MRYEIKSNGANIYMSGIEVDEEDIHLIGIYFILYRLFIYT